MTFNSTRVQGNSESKGKKDDGETHTKKLAEELDIKLESWGHSTSPSSWGK